MSEEADSASLLISSLLDELDFRDSQPKEVAKLNYLKAEILSAVKNNGSVARLCRSFEGGNRLQLLQQGDTSLENFVSSVCRTLQLHPIQEVAIAFALSKSQFRLFAKDALLLLRSKLPEVGSTPNLSEIAEETLYGLAKFISTTEEFAVVEVSGQFIEAVKTFPWFSQIVGQSGAPTGQSSARSLPKIAKMLTEVGPQCSTSQDLFRRTIHSQGVKLDEEQTAAIIVTVLSRIESEEHKLAGSWNLENVAEVLNQDCRGLNWGLVAKFLDLPSLTIQTESDFHLLTRMFVRVAGVPVPAAGFLAETWNNKTAQFAILTLAANSARNIVDFSALVSSDQLIPGDGIATPPNLSWLCLNLFSKFLDLANSGMPMEVLDVLSKAAASYPEYFLLGLAQVQDASSGVRSELLRRLLPLFTGLQGSRPSSLAVMKKLLMANADLLVLLCRIAFKKAKKAWEVVNIDNLLKGFNVAIVRRVEEEASPEELLSYWCIKADRGELNFEEKATALLTANAKNARVMITFAKQHIETLRSRASLQQNTDSGILSFECCAVMLRGAQAFPTVVSLDEIRAIATLFTQQQQQQQQQQQLYASFNQNQQQPQTSAAVLGGVRSAAADVGGGRDQQELARMPPGPEADEVEALANSYFQKIYTSDISIPEVIVLLKQFKASTEKREQEIFRCMVHNLFDEYRFFQKYPEKELQVTGRLYGTLIQHQLVSSITLGIALRYVLEALRKDPEVNEGNDKMFRFGRIALEQFRSRLSEWPQYCSHLIQIPHLSRHCPDMYQEAQKALSNQQQPQSQVNIQQQQMLNQQQQMHSNAGGFDQVPQQQHQGLNMGMGFNNNSLQPQNNALGGMSTLGGGNLAQQFMNLNIGGSNTGGNPLLSTPFQTDNLGMPPLPPRSSSLLDSSSVMSNNATERLSGGMGLMSPALDPTTASNFGSSAAANTPLAASMSPQMAPLPAAAVPASEPLPPQEATSSEEKAETPVDNSPPRRSEVDRMAEVNVDVLNTTMPPESVRDQMHFIVNNIAKSNFEQKTNEIREILKPEHFNWFANYLVVKRISTQPNLHPLYLSVLDALDFTLLGKLVLDSAYHNVTKLLQSPNITTSSSERSLLRNLGVWLGQVTLAKNKPLLQRRINLKELLFWGFETGRLIAVCSFVAKVVEGVKDSRVFRPPNPWLMAILRIMKELYEIEDLKLNIKFEVQVLCKNINIKIEDVPKGNDLAKCRMPVKDQRNPDFNFKPTAATPALMNTSPALSAISAPGQTSPSLNSTPVLPPLAPTATTLLIGSQQVSPLEQLSIALANLANTVNINPSLQYFATNPNQRRLVAAAVERGIREIIQSAVDRSVTIAVTTTKQLILKDFATEPSEQNLKNGSHLMVASLAGSLALATCKEPLRISIGNHLRTLLAQAISDQTLIEQLVQVCSNDNVDLGSNLIEKASVEKAVREIDEVLAEACAARRNIHQSPQSQPFVDQAALQAGNTATSKYPAELHEMLRPRMGGLSTPQLQIYEAFQRMKMTPYTPSTPPLQGQQAPGQDTRSPSLSSMASHASNMGILDMKALPPSSPITSMTGAYGVQQMIGQSSGSTLSMSMALESYQLLLARLDNALKVLNTQRQGRDINLSVLGNDHEIPLILRDLALVTQRTQLSVRYETAMTFSENIFNRMFDSFSQPDPLRLEVLVSILETIRDACGGSKSFQPDFISWLGKYAMLVNNDEMSRKVYRLILILLLRAKLLRSNDVDMYFAVYIDGGRNLFWLELALSFIRQCIVEGLCSIYDFTNTFDTVTKMRPTNMVLKKQLQKWLTDINTLTAAQEEQKALANGTSTGSLGGSVGGSAVAPTAARDTAVREHVTVLLDRWLRVWNSVNDQIFGQYLQLMHQYGVLKTEEAADRFFRVSVEICAEVCSKSGAQQASTTDLAAPLNYTVIDAVSKLFLLLVRLADKEATDMSVRVNLLSRILNAAARAVLEDHEAKKLSKQPFDQRPYYRLFSNMSHDLTIPDPKQEPNPVVFAMLAAYTHVYLALQPTTVPGFAYAWLQLVARRSFMPNLLLAKGQKGWPHMHRLLVSMLMFLQPFLKAGTLSEPIRKLYKGTLRLLLVLLHDFPEFLSDFHLSFCDIIPLNCVQLRNLVLSAFPRSMKLPDPFTPNLKIESLPEAAQAPRILTDYLAPISGIRVHLDSYMTTKQPAELPTKLPTILSSANGTYNLPLITSLVMYMGSLAIIQAINNKVPMQNSPALDVYKQLTVSLDAEGRFIVLNTIVNQLRYPNSHTNFFSFVTLHLFAESENEYLQEQITRVMLERLIAQRPHPWGLLVTFIELIKNPRYGFWRKTFVRSAPEMERAFESIARSCMGPNAAALIQQQTSSAQASPQGTPVLTALPAP